MSNESTILAIGDVHLGTRCSGVPDSITELGVEANELTPAAALRLATEFAIEQQVDAVLFAGDVVENTNARFEALPHLEACVKSLLAENIEVIAVAGNHDVEALPRLANLLDGFTLLGAGGKWESKLITKNDIPVTQIIGWSFKEQIVRKSPVAQLLSEPIEDLSTSIPRIGLLHADLGVSGSKYAPVSQSELENTNYDAWLLGHIHKPSLENSTTSSTRQPIGYLGSLTGLDRSETGVHGPWLITIRSGAELKLQQIPLAPLRWERVQVSVDGIEFEEDLEDRLFTRATAFIEQFERHGNSLSAVGLIVELVGTSSCHDEINKWITKAEWKSVGRLVDGIAVFFSKIVANMQPKLDLAEISKGDDPAALLAQRLIVLENNSDESADLLDRARSSLKEIAEDNRYSVVNDHRNAEDPLSDSVVRELLVRSGTAALSAMISQREQSNST